MEYHNCTPGSIKDFLISVGFTPYSMLSFYLAPAGAKVLLKYIDGKLTSVYPVINRTKPSTKIWKGSVSKVAHIAALTAIPEKKVPIMLGSFDISRLLKEAGSRLQDRKEFFVLGTVGPSTKNYLREILSRLDTIGNSENIGNSYFSRKEPNGLLADKLCFNALDVLAKDEKCNFFFLPVNGTDLCNLLLSIGFCVRPVTKSAPAKNLLKREALSEIFTGLNKENNLVYDGFYFRSLLGKRVLPVPAFLRPVTKRHN